MQPHDPHASKRRSEQLAPFLDLAVYLRAHQSCGRPGRRRGRLDLVKRNRWRSGPLPDRVDPRSSHDNLCPDWLPASLLAREQPEVGRNHPDDSLACAHPLNRRSGKRRQQAADGSLDCGVRRPRTDVDEQGGDCFVRQQSDRGSIDRLL